MSEVDKGVKLQRFMTIRAWIEAGGDRQGQGKYLLGGKAMAENDSFSALNWLRPLLTVAWLVVFVNWPHITVAVTLLIIGGVFIAYNAIIFWLTVIRKEHASSVAPIFGGILVAAGIVILPASESWKWFWIPLLIDWGGLPLFLTAWFSTRAKS